MSIERIYDSTEKEYKTLSLAAEMMTYLSPTGTFYMVGDTYLDYDSNWKWTTIIAHKDGMDELFSSYQALTPREYKELLEADSIECILEIVREHFKSQFCVDKIEESRS